MGLARLCWPLSAALCLLLPWSNPGAAAIGDTISFEESRIRLIAAPEPKADGTLLAGVEIRLEPDWKTYWRMAGDAGYGLMADWAGSDNLARAELLWPVPERFTLFGLDSFGYADHIVLPVILTPKDTTRPISLRAKVDYLVCRQVCIPRLADLELVLPADPKESEAIEATTLLAAALEGLPDSKALPKFHIQHQSWITDTPAPYLELHAETQDHFQFPDVAIEARETLRFERPLVFLSADRKQAILRSLITNTFDPAASQFTEPLTGTVTLFDQGRGTEQKLQPALAARDTAFTDQPEIEGGPWQRLDSFAGSKGAAGQGFAVSTLIFPLLLAILGGLILNGMPCVLPVLSIKLLSVLEQSGSAQRDIRRSFLATSAGILFSFLVLAGLLAALKAGGQAIGWGMQFQNPFFLVFLILVTAFFALNLFGFVIITGPSLTWRGAGGSEANQRQHPLLRAFASGALATLLATPCSAPFVGTAVSFALAAATAEIFLIFSALAIGMASPYLAVAAYPQLIAFLPRPGSWMQKVRWGMGLALIVTALWLLMVLGETLSPFASYWVAGFGLAAVGLLAMRRFSPKLGRAVPLLLLFPIAASLAVPMLVPPAPLAVAQAGDTLWQNFPLEEIPLKVGAGETVILDITAEWCLTCKINDALILQHPEVVAALGEPNRIALRVDWTRRDDRIAAYLASFGRYGIPFNAVFGPAMPSGIVLPELYTRQMLLDILRKAQDG